MRGEAALTVTQISRGPFREGVRISRGLVTGLIRRGPIGRGLVRRVLIRSE